MRLSEVEKKARNLGIKDTWRFSKKDLIRTIQRNEGFSDCFAAVNKDSCNQTVCCWRNDCLK